jgi:hypothetical protein
MILWRIYVPQELAVQIELQLADPLRDKPEYGARSQLVTYLLQEHVNRIHEQRQLKLKGET